MSDAFALSAELRLLAACGISGDEALADIAGETLHAGFDWNRFARLADEHSLTAIAAARLDRIAARAMPRGTLPPVAESEGRNKTLHLLQTASTVGISSLLSKAGIRNIVLKGVALAKMLYAPEPHWRESGDIDLLIAEEDLLAADHVLTQHGFVRTAPAGPLPRKGFDMLLRLANVFDYHNPVTGELIELHHRIACNPYWLPLSFDEFHAASVEIRTEAGTIRGLDGAVMVTYLCWHALAHHGYRLKWFCDIARALERSDAASCAQLAMSMQAPLPGSACEIVDAALAPILDAVRAPCKVRVRPDLQRDARRIIADLEAPDSMPTSRDLSRLAGEIGFVRFLMRLGPCRRGRLYELLHFAADPRDVAALGLGRKWSAAYMVAGPALSAGRFVARRWRNA